MYSGFEGFIVTMMAIAYGLLWISKMAKRSRALEVASLVFWIGASFVMVYGSLMAVGWIVQR